MFCFRNDPDGGGWVARLFSEWVEYGTVVRMDIRHWLHRWDAVVIRQQHMKYRFFMSAMSGAILAYVKSDVDALIAAYKTQDEFKDMSNLEVMNQLSDHHLATYARRVTRGATISADEVEAVLVEFKGPAGLDTEGIPLFKSDEDVDMHWANAIQHLECIQVSVKK